MPATVLASRVGWTGSITRFRHRWGLSTRSSAMATSGAAGGQECQHVIAIEYWHDCAGGPIGVIVVNARGSRTDQ